LARNLDPKCKQCRREGEKLFLKGEKCFTDKCGIEKRSYPPGQHGQRRGGRLSDYGVQLREKQKLRKIYGILEKQFRSYYAEADRLKGVTGENLLQLLESRLDNVIYRAGFASTRPQARQLVSHRHFKLNGKFVDVPSHKVKPGDVIEIKDASKDLIIIQHTIDTGQDNVIPSWLDVDNKKKSVKINAEPSRGDASSQIEEQLIVELYSK